MLIQVYYVLFCLLHIWMEITLFNYMLSFVAEYVELTQIELKIENQKIYKLKIALQAVNSVIPI